MEKETLSSQEDLCQNCGTPLQGAFCYCCGQKKITKKESFFKMMVHFVGDFFHFDAQLFNTLKPLFTKPGLVPKDYINGKRKRHLDPIKMYVFVSILFFGILLAFNNQKSKNSTPINISTGQSNTKSSEENGDLVLTEDTLSMDFDLVDNTQTDTVNSVIQKEIIQLDSLTSQLKSTPIRDTGAIYFGTRLLPKTIEAYEIEQAALSKEKRDGWFKSLIILKIIKFSTEVKQNPEQFIKRAIQAFIKALPKILFIILPILALFLKILYWRREAFYIDHLIFMIYFLCLFYIINAIGLTVNYLLDTSVGSLTLLYSGGYFLLAMKRFYDQPWPKTILKYFVFSVASFFLLMFAAVFGFLFTLLTI